MSRRVVRRTSQQMIFLMVDGMPTPGAEHEKANGALFNVWVDTSDRGEAVTRARDELGKMGWLMDTVMEMETVTFRHYLFNRKARKMYKAALDDGISIVGFYYGPRNAA
jgi:hypothetical protein